MRKRYTPFVLTLLVIMADQVSKSLIVRYIPEGTVALSFFSDWLWICHVRNTAVAFSLGTSLPQIVKYFAFIGLPVLLM